MSQKFGGPSPKKFGGPKTSKFRILRFGREYLQKGTRYRRSENGVKNCNHSPTRVPNLVNFGPQTAKNRTCISTHSIDFFGRSYLSSRSTRDCRRHVTDDVTAQRVYGSREIRSVYCGRDSDIPTETDPLFGTLSCP